MESLILDWLGLAIRWAHVITGIAWIGSSFYFMWLDAHLESPARKDDVVEGELWMVHSGAFYRVDKLKSVPAPMPETLHWFKWEAAFTGITGVLLLAVVYYMGSSAYLIDRGVADLSRVEAVLIGIGVLSVGWVVYDQLFESRFGQENGGVASAISLLLLCLVAIGLTHLLSARAAYIHVGGLTGIVMVLNVWVRIIPGQEKMIASRIKGETPDLSLGHKAKQRSVHNNYLTLPVIFIMLSSHYPMTFGYALPWLVLILIGLSGALVRHWFNLKNEGRPHPWPVVAAIAVYLLTAAFVSWPSVPPGGAATAAVPASAAYAIVQSRCVACHSAKPTFEGIDVAPKGIRFDTIDQVAQQAALIKKVAVDTQVMPLGNVTKMTKGERQTLRDWLRMRAKAP